MEEQDKLELAYEEILQEVRPLPLISISRILGRAKLTATTSSLQLDELKRQRALDEVRLLTVAVPRDSAAQLTPFSRRASRSTRSPRKMQRMTVCVHFALVIARASPTDSRCRSQHDEADQSWDHVELDDLVSPPVASAARRTTRKGAFSRALTVRTSTSASSRVPS